MRSSRSPKYRLIRRDKIRKKIRSRIKGTELRPRLCVYKSNAAFYAQLINDDLHATMVSADTRPFGHKNKASVEQAADLFAGRAAEKGVSAVVFDRSGYRYHGLVKVFFDKIREKGLVG